MPATGPGTGIAGEPHQRLARALEQQEPRESGEQRAHWATLRAVALRGNSRKTVRIVNAA